MNYENIPTEELLLLYIQSVENYVILTRKAEDIYKELNSKRNIIEELIRELDVRNKKIESRTDNKITS